MRLIDADELLKDKVSNAYVSRFEIENAPTIDAEPVVHAHWIRKRSTPFSGDNDWECSNCGNGCRLDIGYRPKKYCGDCGAKMDEENNKGKQKTDN